MRKRDREKCIDSQMAKLPQIFTIHIIDLQALAMLNEKYLNTNL